MDGQTLDTETRVYLFFGTEGVNTTQTNVDHKFLGSICLDFFFFAFLFTIWLRFW